MYLSYLVESGVNKPMQLRVQTTRQATTLIDFQVWLVTYLGRQVLQVQVGSTDRGT